MAFPGLLQGSWMAVGWSEKGMMRERTSRLDGLLIPEPLSARFQFNPPAETS